MNRRKWMQSAALAAGTLAACGLKRALVAETAAPSAPAPGTAATPAVADRDLWRRLPRWRGFNLLEKFNVGRNKPFVETDFEWMAAWGFDFVRLPMDYRCWTDPADPYRFNEGVLKEIDQAVEFGRKYKVHVSLNLHRAPGYTVAKPPEKMNLWTDEEAQKQFDAQWSAFARRYKGMPNAQVSINLVNEPDNRVSAADYAKVVARVAKTIRSVDPDRLIMCDALQWGNKPVPELADLGVAQCTRGYQPMQITHYKAAWVGGERWAEPSWPLKLKDKTIDKETLRRERIEPFRQLAARGVGVMVGEWGAYNFTPHAVTLAWMRDCLDLWKEAGWGWALWNFRGPFGILDSGRADVTYEDFKGHKLDRKMLDLLRQS